LKVLKEPQYLFSRCIDKPIFHLPPERNTQFELRHEMCRIVIVRITRRACIFAGEKWHGIVRNDTSMTDYIKICFKYCTAAAGRSFISCREKQGELSTKRWIKLWHMRREIRYQNVHNVLTARIWVSACGDSSTFFLGISI
jgi:hypothetical protein